MLLHTSLVLRVSIPYTVIGLLGGDVPVVKVILTQYVHPVQCDRSPCGSWGKMGFYSYP